MKTLLIDNKDSFTQNIRHLIMNNTNANVTLIQNDYESFEFLHEDMFDSVVISPGPGNPSVGRDFGICRHIIENWSIPLLGICLGHQGIADVFGGVVRRAQVPMHGRVVTVHHAGDELFEGIPPSFFVVRYHSLIVAPELPDTLQAIAWSETLEIMALRHKSKPMWGVQFHPESICSEFGPQLVQNFGNLALAFGAASTSETVNVST